MADADIVCTLTPATTPILHGAWLKPGAHVNAVGCCTPRERELDLEVVARARLFVDTKAACVKEPGDLVIPLQNGAPAPPLHPIPLCCFAALQPSRTHAQVCSGAPSLLICSIFPR